MDSQIRAIRHFLIHHFNDTELTNLCFDHFPNVSIEFTNGMTLSQKAQLLLEHCHQHENLPQLISILGLERTEQMQGILSIVIDDTHIDWGNAFKVSTFLGRMQELKVLEKWLVSDTPRFISVLGMGGIGKTTLMRKAVEMTATQFEYVVWRSLQNAPRFDEFLDFILHFLYYPHGVKVSQQLDDKFAHLASFFRRHRCLLVLDNVEAILDGQQVGHYREEYKDYGNLINYLAQVQHQSTIMLSSREVPRDLVFLESDESLVCSLPVLGLSPSASISLLESKGLIGSEDIWTTLIEFYSGNPLALNIVAEMIREIYGGDIANFIDDGDPIFGGIYDVISEQFNRLSYLEQSIMYWLAIEREPASLETLWENLVPIISDGKVHINRKRDVSIALRSLRRRSLIETSNRNFFLENVTAEFVVNYFVNVISYEIKNNELSLFLSHALVKAQVKEYVRDSQIQFLLKAVLSELLSEMGSPALVAERLLENFSFIREYLVKQRLPNYAASNTIHLLQHLNYSLNNLDFSNSVVWQADLRTCQLHNVNLSGADLRYSVFAEQFSSILTVALSPDEQLYAAGTENGEIRLWSVTNNKSYYVFEGHNGWIRTVAFSPNGRLLISGGDDQCIKFWSTRTRQCIATIPESNRRILSLVVSPNGQMCASGNSDGTVLIWNLETRELLYELKEHRKFVWSIAFSHDSRYFVSGGDDAYTHVWEVATGKLLVSFYLKEHKVRSVSFSKHDNIIATGSEDRTIVLWSMASGKILRVLKGHESRINSIAYSLNGDIIASGSEDGTVRIWDVHTGNCNRVLKPEGDAGRIISVAFHADNRRLITGSQDRFIRIWDVTSGQCLRAFHGYHNWVRSVSFSSTGQIVASGNQDQTIILWNSETGQIIRRLEGHSHWVWVVAFSPNRDVIASGSQDQTIKLWDVKTGLCLRTLSGHSGRVMSVAFSSDSNLLFSGSNDHSIRVWRVSDGIVFHTLEGHKDRIRSVAISPDNKVVASGSEDQTIMLWDIETGSLINTIEAHVNCVTCVAFNPNNKLLASCSYDHTIKFWDYISGEYLHTLQGHTDLVMAISFSPDGKRLASCSLDQTVRLWEVASGNCIWTARQHTSWVRSVAFSPNGKVIVSASDDETIKFWDPNNGECTKTLRVNRPYEEMDITGIKGITEIQRVSLLDLGAIDRDK